MKIYFSIMVALFIAGPQYAQLFKKDTSNITSHDTTFYTTFENKFTVRILTSRKYASMEVKDLSDEELKIRYEPNSPVSLGVGATYKWATVNVLYGFDFLNKNSEDKGDTKYFDFKMHLLGRRSNIDFGFQLYKGFHTDDLPHISKFVIRPDMQISSIGMLYEFMPNWRRFSLRSSINQSERQHKSAGTPLIGFGLEFIKTKGDSTLKLNNGADSTASFSVLNTWEFGPSLGYAYTLVYARNLFLTGSASLRLGFSSSELKGTKENGIHFALRPDWQFRMATGYVGNNWGASFLWQGRIIKSGSKTYNYQFDMGRFTLAVTKKLNLRKRNDILKFIDKVDSRYIDKVRSKKYN